MANTFGPTRRNVLKAVGAGLPGAALPAIGSRARAAGGLRTVNMQLGWITGGNQIGEVVAKRLGYFDDEKIDFAIQPGGPNIDGVAIVASGRYEVGQVSSSPSLMLAASQGIPVICFAVGAQEHPYAYFSLPRAPIHTPQDMIGRKIGVQATGQILLTALLRKNGIPEDKVEKVIVGSEHDAAAHRPGRRDRRLEHQHDRAEGARPRLSSPCGCGITASGSTRCPITRPPISCKQARRARRLPARGRPRLGLRQGQSGEVGRSADRRNIPISCAPTNWPPRRS